MEDRLKMSNKMYGMWSHAKTPEEYHKLFSSELPSGIVDEIHVSRFFNNYLSQKQKVIVDLGIGTGRELSWIDSLKSLSQIIGLDYSYKMVTFCKKSAYLYKHKFICFRDDLLNLKHLPGFVELVKEPIIYLSLINSLGNFSATERIRCLKQLKPLLRPADRIVLCLYKRPTLKMKKYLPSSFPESALPKSKINRTYLTFIREYAFFSFIWHSIIAKGKFPRFWYNSRTNDLVIHIDGKRVVISHRFNKVEIKEFAKKAGLSIEKLITGKFMYVVMLKKR
jgi:hypothetical protein